MHEENDVEGALVRDPVELYYIAILGLTLISTVFVTSRANQIGNRPVVHVLFHEAKGPLDATLQTLKGLL